MSNFANEKSLLPESLLWMREHFAGNSVIVQTAAIGYSDCCRQLNAFRFKGTGSTFACYLSLIKVGTMLVLQSFALNLDHPSCDL
jgi:hypothetical protein